MNSFNIKKIHYVSGIILCIFIFAHLTNHLSIFFGKDTYFQIMDSLRLVYRNPIAEVLLLTAVGLQVFTGISLFKKLKAQNERTFAEKYQILSGLYLAFFLLIHVSAILGGRILFALDTNFYFGTAGLNIFPLFLFFVPYYFLAIASIFTHIACIHFRKTNSLFQSKIIFGFGIFLATAIIFGMTKQFQGFEIPTEYLKSFGM